MALPVPAPVTRFAPSPTGFLHIGHALAARIARDAARAGGGRFVLRIEDIDTARCRPAFEAAILEDLRWLGLAWDGPVMRQSERRDAYAAALERLDAQGLVYPCFCTRRAIADEIAAAGGAPHGPEGPLYPGTCRGLPRTEADARIAAGEPHALRLDSARAIACAGALTFRETGGIAAAGSVTAAPARLGDIVLARKDLGVAYHLAVVVDDAAQGVSLVTRGADLFPATHVQRLLQALLDLPCPDYLHHGLVLAADGRKFSKRDGAVTIAGYREAGRRAGDVFADAERLTSR